MPLSSRRRNDGQRRTNWRVGWYSSWVTSTALRHPLVGIDWPETPPVSITRDPSPRILNVPDLPQDEKVLETFAHEMDLRLKTVIARSHPLDTLTPEQAGLLQGSIIQASVKLTAELSPPKCKKKTGRGCRYKDGYSPEYTLQHYMPIRTSVVFYGGTCTGQGDRIIM